MREFGLPLMLATFFCSGVLAAQDSERTSAERNRITPEEIESKASDAVSAYEIVQRLRPHFLRVRALGGRTSSLRTRQQSGDSDGSVKVIVEGGRRGTAALLNEIAAYNVIEISHLNGSDATTRFGSGYERGVIVVKVGNRTPPPS